MRCSKAFAANGTCEIVCTEPAGVPPVAFKIIPEPFVPSLPEYIATPPAVESPIIFLTGSATLSHNTIATPAMLLLTSFTTRGNDPVPPPINGQVLEFKPIDN